MELDDVMCDREPQSEAAGAPRVLALTESLENVRQQIRIDTRARVAHADARDGTPAFEPQLNAAVLRGELDSVGQQVPHDLLKTVRVCEHESHGRVEADLERDALGVTERL